MNAPIRRISLVVVLLVVALLANATWVQVFRADDLRSDSRNERVLLDEYARQRSLPPGPSGSDQARAVSSGSPLDSRQSVHSLSPGV